MQKIERGCWGYTSNAGECVVVDVNKDWIELRYKAIHLASGKEMWVLTSVPTKKVQYVKPADDLSNHVLGLRGIYGNE